MDAAAEEDGEDIRTKNFEHFGRFKQYDMKVKTANFLV